MNLPQTLAAVLLTLSGLAAAQTQVDDLLAATEAPAGVVFEIVEGDEEALRWALPEVARQAGRLRERFPGLVIVVVSHGREQFGLLRDADGPPTGVIHDAARGLQHAQIDLHVCGTHAGWYGHAPEDFPDYVDVSASGPAQLNDYRNLGYTVIRLRCEPPCAAPD